MKNKELERHLKSCFKRSDALVIVALMFLSNKKSLVPEIMSIFDLETLNTFLYLYGGETIQIPTVKDFEFQLTCAIALYYKEVKGKRWDWIRKRLDLDNYQEEKVKKSCAYFLKNAKECDLNFLKNISDQGDILE